MALHIIASFFATIAFCILFSAPMKEYIYCGFTGTIAWISYLQLTTHGLNPTLSIYIAAVILTGLARIFAIARKVPVTVYLIAGIFPLVPGAGIYYTTYYLINSEVALAVDKGIETIKFAVAISLGIMSILAVPKRIMNSLALVFHKNKRPSAK